MFPGKRKVLPCFTALAIALSACIGLFDRGIAAAAGNERRFDDWVSGYREEGKIPGVTVVLIGEDSTPSIRSYGYADEASGREATEDTAYGLASLSKAFTGFAILQMAEEGKLDLDDPVQRYLPWFRSMA